MAVRVVVETGPRAGWSYLVLASEARLGSGVGAAIDLNDPGLAGGGLRLGRRDAGWELHNQQPHAVWLGDTPLAAGASRTWFHGDRLKPTADTTLGFEAAAPFDGPVPPGGVIAEPPGLRAPKRSGPSVATVAAAVALVVAGGFAWAVKGGPAPRGPLAESRDLVRALAEWAPTDPTARRVKAILTDAVVSESEGDLRTAGQRYRDIGRDIANGPGTADPVYAATAAFAARRSR